jgi:CRISPR-associated protein Csd1
MILQALAAYYDRLESDVDSDVAPPGFEKKGIPFLVELDRNGKFTGLDDTRTTEGPKKVARPFRVPKAEKRASNIVANLLWDNPAYVFGKPKPDPKRNATGLAKRAVDQHHAFVARVRDTFPEPVADDGVAAVMKFLDKGDFGAVLKHRLWDEVEETGGNIAFKLKGDDRLVCQRDAVTAAVVARLAAAGGDKQQCLITGEFETTARLHSPISGVRGAKNNRGDIVSFNQPAFRSRGKDQGLNAPVGTTAEHAYTTALNTLLERNSRQKMLVGDATAVFWAEKAHRMERLFADFFGEPPNAESSKDTEAIRALYGAPESGAIPLLDDKTKFYVLGLAPNVSRLAVRFWYAGSVGEVAGNIRQHFDDTNIVHRSLEPEHLSLFRLLVSTAVKSDSKNIQPNLAGDVMKAILSGTPYPATLLSSAVRRIRAEREISYPRVSVIKACLVRDSRFHKRSQEEVGMALDPTNSKIGYRLGRLFAVLEKAQEEANPGINSTIRDQFYGAASSTPVTGFFVPMRHKNYHLAKLENRGRAVNLDKLIGEIVDGIDDFPAHLELQDQGRFHVGYYHQRQALFTKKSASQGGDTNVRAD